MNTAVTRVSFLTPVFTAREFTGVKNDTRVTPVFTGRVSHYCIAGNQHRTAREHVCHFSERELTFTFAIMLSPVRLSSVVCLSSVTLMRPTQAVQIFGNVSTALGTLAIR